MSQNLVIVESPAKARTLSRFLGSDFVVLASMGHIRDLPHKGLGIDVEHNFEPTYAIPPKAGPVIKQLTQALHRAKALYLATDPDREGEAIAWHLKEVLHPHLTVSRISFHEISKDAVLDAMKHGRQIDLNLVEAQVARRVLDRLVGYSLSPLLWKKVAAGLSAGRVQSVAVRLIVDRENEIKAFNAIEYWSLVAKLQTTKEEPAFEAGIVAIDGKPVGRVDLKADQAQELEKNLKQADFVVKSVDSKEVKRAPAPPFTTSTLQQEASRKLGFSAKRTMTVAQHLYEDGVITYMRTDSVTIASHALQQARTVIAEDFGVDFLPPRSRFYTNKSKNAQEAHEAIRPVKLVLRPKSLDTADSGARRLYELIWKRTIASQMADARFKRTSVDIAASNCTFRATGQIPIFLGFIKVYTEGKDEGEDQIEGLLPEINVGQKLHLLDLLAEQHFTEPPPRYTEATLVKTLEELGIGRPSTYAPTLQVIQDRGYTVLEEKKFVPQDVGMIVTELLVKNFPSIVDYQFTADMEKKLDDIADGKRDRAEVLDYFYKPFITLLKQKEKELDKKELMEEKTDRKCPKCGKPLVIKIGRFGKFYACSGYPECDYTDKMAKSGKPAVPVKPLGRNCPLCGNELVERTGRFGTFVGCSTFPKCRYIEQVKGEDLVPCPKCGKMLVPKRTKRGKVFWGCSDYPKCDYATWNDPTKIPPTLENSGASESAKKGARSKAKGRKFASKRRNNTKE